MKLFRALIGLLLIAWMMPSLAAGQDLFGVRDTVYADIDKIADDIWTVTVSISNDEDVEGLSVPLRFSAGDDNKIVADSAVYTGGRVEHFALKAFRPDTSIQCVTLGMVANLGPTANKLTPGTGRLVTVFISSMENKPIENLTVDTTTTHPNNFLMVVASRSNWGEHSLDTIPIEKRKELEISPMFVVRARK